MQISVECGGFTRAADAIATANQTAAVLTESLSRRLDARAGMAGDDATSATFAQAYDAGAEGAVSALADLTHAFVGAVRLLEATGDNHARAESAAAGREVKVLGYSGRHLADACVRVSPRTPPSSLGAQEPSFGVVDRWILDHVEGFVWPGADVERLRAAASTWRRSASAVGGLADHLDAASSLVSEQRSPEVPLAVDALGDLGVLVGDTAWQLSRLADACEEYAAEVEAAHERTRALLEEIARMVVEGAAISAVVTGLTGGLGGGASLAAAAARVRAQAPRFTALLLALRTGAATIAARLERVVEDLALIRAKVERFIRVPARSEAGTIGPVGRGFPRGWLREHEVPPGHTIREHVGRSVDELAARLSANSRLSRASSFDDQQTAERLIATVLERRADEISEWARSSDRRLSLVEDLGERTGTSVTSEGVVTAPRGIRLVLQADASAPDGWRILTAFPD